MDRPAELTIDTLAALAGTTTRSVRSFQTMGLLPRPRLRGRTGIYSTDHLDRLSSILRLQSEGFSLQSIGHLLLAHSRGETLGDVLGIATDPPAVHPGAMEESESYAFVDLPAGTARALTRRGRAVLSIVPTTVWDVSAAS